MSMNLSWLDDFLALAASGNFSRAAVGTITLISDVFARCEAMLLESQVQFVMSHAHPQASSALVAQGFPFVRVGSDQADPGVGCRCDGPLAPLAGPRHAKFTVAAAELQHGVRTRPHPA